MTQQEKELLLIDLCGRSPYGVICHTEKGDGHLVSINQTIFGTEYGLNINPLKRDYFSDSKTEEQAIKPYLRPMSSMTEKEQKEFDEFICIDEDAWRGNGIQGFINQSKIMSDGLTYLLSHHLDYNGLIPMGLALEAKEGMYKTE